LNQMLALQAALQPSFASLLEQEGVMSPRSLVPAERAA
jgi:hypothetical protein